MTLVLNIEASGLDPKEIWCATTIDINTGEEREFIRPDLEPKELVEYVNGRDCVGHNIIGYDNVVLRRFISEYRPASIRDTLVVSRTLDFNRLGGHSLAAWSPFLKVAKTEQPPWMEFSRALVDHSMQNCRLTVALWKHFTPWLKSPRWQPVFDLEHFMAEELQEMKSNGFHFDVDKARELWYTINTDVERMDTELLTTFPPKVSFIREVTPRLTKFGTFNRNDFRFVEDGDLSEYNGGPFSRIDYIDFNPGSTTQIVERMNEAGWRPVNRTKGYLKALRDQDQEKLAKYHDANTGWMVDETNLDTLPDTAPPAARTLAKRLKYASRVRVLSEWLNCVGSDSRVHGTVNHIGAWTGRCSHDKPNTGNIPRVGTEFGAEFRSLWGVDQGWQVGVDAESIQLRILAHYINDDRFTNSLVSGDKELGTDPHSLNKSALGEFCATRDIAKTFIYAWLLGAGNAKVADILGCSVRDAAASVKRFEEFYPGLVYVKREIIPRDAARGYFEGFDGRYVKIFGDDIGSREHFALAGYLQGGEATIMKTAANIWLPKLRAEGVPFKWINFVHDEFQTQVYGDKPLAEYVAQVQADAIREAGERLNLRCPMAGSMALGKNWLDCH